MRLDKFLKVSRLIKRRSVANEACDAGRVLINGKQAKASTNVKKGDVIEIQFGMKTVEAEVLDIQDTTKKEEAKKEEPKKEEEKKKEPDPVLELVKAYKAYNPHMTTYYHVQSMEENPNSCVIC